MRLVGLRATGLLGCVLVAVASVGVGAASGQGPALTCGQTITTDTTLKGNLKDCPGDGLIVGTPGITIDLAGHTISGTGSGWGVRGVPATIENGAIRGFGVFIAGNDNIFNSVRLLNLQIDGGGVTLLDCGGSEINRVRIGNGGGSGVFADRSPGLRVINSRLVNNGGYGISTHESGGALFENNQISRNASGGIFTVGSVSAFIHNTVTANGGDGIAIFDREDTSPDMFRANIANRNSNLGVSMTNLDAITNAPIPADDQGGNEAKHNGDSRQCVALGLVCHQNGGGDMTG